VATIGVAYDDARLASFQASATDVALELLVTPTRRFPPA